MHGMRVESASGKCSVTRWAQDGQSVVSLVAQITDECRPFHETLMAHPWTWTLLRKVEIIPGGDYIVEIHDVVPFFPGLVNTFAQGSGWLS